MITIRVPLTAEQSAYLAAHGPFTGSAAGHSIQLNANGDLDVLSLPDEFVAALILSAPGWVDGEIAKEPGA